MSKVKFLKSKLFYKSKIKHGFSTREGGISADEFASANMHYRKGGDQKAVWKNRENFLESIGLKTSNLRLVNQSHGSRVELVDSLPLSYTELMEVDGMVTTTPNTALGIYVADCLPVLIADPAGKGVAALHAGWRGVIAGILENGVTLLNKASNTPIEELKVAIGPGIQSCCFEVGEEVAEQFKEKGLAKFIIKHPDKTKDYIDISGAAVQILKNLGIKRRNIDIISKCTKCSNSEFYSYRRDGWPTGQMLGVIAIDPWRVSKE
jgi:purine-nucleoside/S-methyl-5'-thioadenosine phosphorylase / adenosine deaminase